VFTIVLLISASTPYANGWLISDPDGSRATSVRTDEFRCGLQRRLGLWISSYVATVRALHANGVPADFFGDYADGRANHRRRHDTTLRCWYDAASAVAAGPVILGDKENSAATAHFNVGHVVDMAEPGAGDGGTDRCSELKVVSGLRAKHEAGLGSSANGGTPANVGHLFAFGNTEERLRLENLGCEPRGHPSQGYFDHATGRGWVKGRRGYYHDSLFNKRNTTDVLLHESLGGGYAPPAVARIRRYARAAQAGVDRTRYTSRRRISYISHHTQRASLGIVKADSRGILDSLGKLSASLARA